MKNRIWAVPLALAVVAVISALAVQPSAGQARPAAASAIPRAWDGKPDLNGIWQALNTANWDIQDHPARQGPDPMLGALFNFPAGQGVVVGNEIPYRPEALARKKENQANWAKLDPEAKCYMGGVPRSNYMPYPFQIVQSPRRMLMVYEFASAVRTIYMNSKDEAPVDSWMGWNRGHWDGDTLVIDVTALNGEAWFDRSGNFQSTNTHLVERYTPIGRDAINYEVTVEDPTLYTRAWKMQMPLYRRLEKNIQLLEYKCVEFAEEMLYGHLRKQPAK